MKVLGVAPSTVNLWEDISLPAQANLFQFSKSRATNVGA